MALPSAPLGSMPNINAPSYIPTTVVNKQPKAWEQVLMQVLGQTLNAGMQAGVGNVMSRDHAEEFGGQKATGFDRLVAGPNVDAKEATQRRGIAAQEREGTRQIEAADRRSTAEIDAGDRRQSIAAQNAQQMANAKAVQELLQQTAQIEAMAEREGMAYDRASAEMDQRGQLSALEARQRAAAERGQNLRAEIGDIRADRRQRSAIEADRPLRDAQTRKYNAEAGRDELMNKRMTPPEEKVDPAYAQFVAGGGQPAARPMTSEQYINTLLQQGVPKEQIANAILAKEQSDVQSAAAEQAKATAAQQQYRTNKDFIDAQLQQAYWLEQAKNFSP